MYIYIIGFLGFREIPSCLNLYYKLKEDHPEMVPQVLLFDGNGTLHPQGIGMASHFGVIANVCTIGVAKSLHLLDYIKKDKKYLSDIEFLKHPGDYFTLENKNGCKVGAVRVTLQLFYNLSVKMFCSIGPENLS